MTIFKGSQVYDVFTRLNATVLKVNKKTYTIGFADGWVKTQDKSYFVR
jgi:hypothetical protein